MALNLRKPTAESLAKPDQLLAIIMALFENVLSLVAASEKSSIVDLGALTADPGVPPLGVVYQYTLNGSLYVRTRTGATLVAA